MTPPTTPEAPRGTWQPADAALLALLLAVGLALRLRVGLDTTYIIHPDETFDYLEQAFRLVFGYGARPWTYEYGLRNWAFPGLLAGVLQLAAWLDPRPAFQLNAVALFMSLVSLTLVGCAFAWGHRAAGRLGAVLAGGLVAVWFELVHFAPKTLQEVMATNLLVLAACLCPDRLGRRPGAAPAAMPRWRLRLLGLCLGLAVALRIQLAPAALVMLLWLLWDDPRRAVLRIAPAAAIPVVAFGLLDWATFGWPFQSFWMNVYANTVAGVSHYFGGGGVPMHALVNVQAHFQGGAAFVAIGLLALAGATRLPLPLLIAASIHAAHALIAHKEYRFIYPAMPFVMALAGIGTAMLVARLREGLPRRAAVALPTVALAAWAFVSWHAATDGPFRREWHRNAGTLAAARAIAERPAVCGIGAYVIRRTALPGHVRFRHDVPIFAVSDPARFAGDARSFDVVIAHDDQLPPGGIFTPVACWNDGWFEASQNRRKPRVCLLERTGPCEPGAVSDPDPDRPPGW